MIKLFCMGLLCFLLVACHPAEKNNSIEKDFISYVNPLIGSGGHGHVFVGVSLPHGMVQLGPNNISKGWDWASGYHDSDSIIIGFSHTHLSGTGIADLADILFMPATQLAHVDGQPLKASEYGSHYQKENQLVTPGYYSVLLDRYNIKAELTATERVGLHQYTYPEDEKAFVVVDLNEGAQSLMARKGTLEASFRQVNDTTITGFRLSDEWATNHKVYFTTVFSEPIRNLTSHKEGSTVKVVLDFDRLNKPLLAKTAISYVSEAGSMKNLLAEMPAWNFEKVCINASKTWNTALGVIDFQSDQEAMEIFYTALYHTMIAPSVFCDVDDQYMGADGKVYTAEGFVPYTTFSLWDTYRAVHPLYTLIDNRVPDYVNTLLAINDQQGGMPVWHLVGNETNCMVGVHSIPVVVDACLKGIKEINKERVYCAVSGFENMNSNGLNDVREKDFIPADKVSWSVARALEYAIDDYAVAQLAKALNKEADYEKFTRRSKNYVHYFDPVSGFMRGKLSDNTWRKDFNPYHSLHLEDDYVEGNAWQYTWLVPHDVEGLISLFGSREKFTKKLDSLFIASSHLNEGASIDISGMIGQYAHGNEPSHHVLYLYAYVGQQWKTAQLVRQVYDQFYKAVPDGLIGNEDCGQMSAWYIFSALGFYPVNPVDGTFVFGSPLAKEAKLHLTNGNTFTVIASNNSRENKYIKSIRLNGKMYAKFYITYQDIMKGGILEFEMGDKPVNTI